MNCIVLYSTVTAVSCMLKTIQPLTTTPHMSKKNTRSMNFVRGKRHSHSVMYNANNTQLKIGMSTNTTSTNLPVLDRRGQAPVDRIAVVVSSTHVTQHHHHGTLHSEQEVIQVGVFQASVRVVGGRVLQEEDFALK